MLNVGNSPKKPALYFVIMPIFGCNECGLATHGQVKSFGLPVLDK
jgi:hypothetical protein